MFCSHNENGLLATYVYVRALKVNVLCVCSESRRASSKCVFCVFVVMVTIL